MDATRTKPPRHAQGEDGTNPWDHGPPQKLEVKKRVESKNSVLANNPVQRRFRPRYYHEMRGKGEQARNPHSRSILPYSLRLRSALAA